MNKQAKIYVAGHRGLVGSAIVRNLRERGYGNLLLRSRQDLDLCDQTAVARFFASERPEYVFLAAAKVGGIVANDSYRADFIYENLQIQNNVIHQSYQHGVKKLMFLGSTCIYPKEAPQPLKEEYLLTGELEYTNEPYAVAKIAGIKMCESYNLQYGTNFISVMPTNLYGPNDNFDLEKSHVLPALLRKIHLGKALESGDWESIRKDLDRLPIEGIGGDADKKEILKILKRYGIETVGDEGGNFGQVSIEIWGSGRPMREFLWSEEMADACVFLMEHVDAPALFPSGRIKRNMHINIGSGEEISIADLAQLIRETVGFSGVFRFNTDKPDGTMRKVTDVSRLHSLGWRHRIGIEEGVRRLYRWYLSEPNSNKG